MKLTGNPRGVQLAIVALLVATLWISCRRAEAAEPVFFAGAGPALHSARTYAHSLRIGMEQGAWQASIATTGGGHIDHPEGRYLIGPNMAACGTWHRSIRRFSLGWGACLWEHGDFSVGDSTTVTWTPAGAELEDDGLQLTAAIVARVTFGAGRHGFIEIFHASTGGSTWHNRGRNLITIGARF